MPSESQSKRCVLLDRDKTVLMPAHGGYIYRTGDFLIPQSHTRALKDLQSAGYLLFIVTNQGGVAKGLLTEEDVRAVHGEMERHFRKHGVRFSGFHYCPHNPEGMVAPYNIVCGCRKPGTGMIDEIVRSNGVDPALSWMVGDSEKDVTAGARAGFSTIRISGGSPVSTKADFRQPDLAAAARTILKYSKR